MEVPRALNWCYFTWKDNNPRILGLGYPDPTDMTVTVTEPNVDPRSLGVPVPCPPLSILLPGTLHSCILPFPSLAFLRPTLRCDVKEERAV